jgi:hypothetical protein
LTQISLRWICEAFAGLEEKWMVVTTSPVKDVKKDMKDVKNVMKEIERQLGDIVRLLRERSKNKTNKIDYQCIDSVFITVYFLSL